MLCNRFGTRTGEHLPVVRVACRPADRAYVGPAPSRRKIAADIVRALDHLHAQGRIHADLKPLNAVRISTTWQLIDLDVSCALGHAFGAKVPSSGYCPPEMARVLLAATDESTGGVDTATLSEYEAHVAYDLWSLGAVLFHLVTGRPLWLTQDDNVGPDDLRKLVSWKGGDLERELKRAVFAPSDDHKTAFDLIRKLLEPDATQRAANFAPGCEMLSVLDHSFFLSKSLADASLEHISRQLDASHALLQTVEGKLDEVRAAAWIKPAPVPPREARVASITVPSDAHQDKSHLPHLLSLDPISPPPLLAGALAPLGPL